MGEKITKEVTSWFKGEINRLERMIGDRTERRGQRKIDINRSSHDREVVDAPERTEMKSVVVFVNRR